MLLSMQCYSVFVLVVNLLTVYAVCSCGFVSIEMYYHSLVWSWVRFGISSSCQRAFGLFLLW